MKKEKKIRIDQLLVDKKLVESRTKAQALIMAGKVIVNDRRVEKASEKFFPDVNIRLKGKLKYVSRGGIKLDTVFKHFNVDVKDRVCIDVGASTGGFTDNLLKRGAKKVYAVDVGTAQLDWKLRTDPRVKVVENRNFRNDNFDYIEEVPTLLVMDVSFISVLKLVDSINKIKQMALEKEGIFEGFILIKPQFESNSLFLNKGVIDDENGKKVALQVREELSKFFTVSDLVASILRGPKGNLEYFVKIQ